MHMYKMFPIIFTVMGMATAVCPGFNFAIGNMVKQEPNDFNLQVEALNRWNIYDVYCNLYDYFTMDQSKNVCHDSLFECCCSGPKKEYPRFWRYNDRTTGLLYNCRPDPNSGKCGDNIISVCCRNDGHKTKRDAESEFMEIDARAEEYRVKAEWEA